MLWDGHSLRDLGAGAAFAINLNGVAAGSSGPHAAVFQNGTVKDLGHMGGDYTRAIGINDSGRVVGFGQFGDDQRAFVYDLPNGPLRDVAPGRVCTFSGVNSRGDAVGTCLPLGGAANAKIWNDGHAVIWRDGVLLDLNDVLGDPAWLLTNAYAINDHGQIAATATNLTDTRLGGAIVLTPR